ncbi:hypothetical protein B9Z55_027394 [Caenorhabditis nigoni]|uniref:Uncharacterized protein n=1 Tax=Caenorhabditis nigoni TaxID=1611254 RepID=A0A2G5SFC9_9PELO|nr:hypothetical protein B9Z55_027394 [Caenorhabditis nigoni]
MKSPDGKQIILADVTVPYEHGVEAMQRAWDRKVEKYTDSFAHLKVGGASLSVLPIVVGTLGTWWKPTSKSLEQLGIEKGVIRRAIPEICSTVLEYSKNATGIIFGKSIPIFHRNSETESQIVLVGKRKRS